MDYKQRLQIANKYTKYPIGIYKLRNNPYEYGDWLNLLTPIELNVWNDIRYLGLPFYPQYPVLKYFVDFADPIKKIIIEVDSKQWHLNKIKDNERDIQLKNDGWLVVRIEGKNTYKDIEYSEEYEEHLSQNVLQELKNTYYGRIKSRSKIFPVV